MFSSLNNLSQKHCNIILKVLTNPNYQYYMFYSLNNLSQNHCNIILKVLTNPRTYLTGAGILKAVSLYSDEGSQLVLKSVIEPLNWKHERLWAVFEGHQFFFSVVFEKRLQLSDGISQVHFFDLKKAQQAHEKHHQGTWFLITF